MKLGLCAGYALQSNSSFFATVDGYKCFVSEMFALWLPDQSYELIARGDISPLVSQVSDDNCNIACFGDSDQSCGESISRVQYFVQYFGFTAHRNS